MIKGADRKAHPIMAPGIFRKSKAEYMTVQAADFSIASGERSIHDERLGIAKNCVSTRGLLAG